MNAAWVFEELITHIRDRPADEVNLLAKISAAESEYLDYCRAGEFRYTSDLECSEEWKKIMHYLYNTHLVKTRNDIHERIRMTVSDTKCAYCHVRHARSLDHYKEKAKFPLLSITPGNLIPSCTDCNSQISGIENKFHPYYDQLMDSTWLVANVTPFESSFDVIYGIDASKIKNVGLLGRVMETFKAAGLAERWSTELGGYVETINRTLKLLSSQEEKLEWLVEEMERYETLNPPLWALYGAMARNLNLRRAPINSV